MADSADNTTAIEDFDGQTIAVELSNRTLYKDGAWNTLCLPFDVTISGSALDGAIARPLSEGSITGTTLNLTFGDAVETLTAGTPYIIKWDDDTNIVNPMFMGVTISKADCSYDNNGTGDERVRFLGTYKSTTFENEDESILFLGAQNTLYYPQPSGDMKPTIGALRAYFKIGEDGATARQLTEFNIDFGDGEASGITTTDCTDNAGAWYDISGRRLSGKPTRRGLYINNGRLILNNQ